MRNRYLRLFISLAAAIAVSVVIIVSTGEKQPTYRSVVVVSEEIETNTSLSKQNLTVKNIPANAVPEEALETIPQGKLAGQKLWPGQFLLLPMVKDNPVMLPEPDNRFFSIPINLKTAGGIQQGDRVDVFFFTEDKGSQGNGESKLILSGITVVNILNQNGQGLAGKSDKVMGSAAVPAVVEVLVTAAQANLLNAAANIGTLALARYLPESQPVTDLPAVIVNGGDVQW